MSVFDGSRGSLYAFNCWFCNIFRQNRWAVYRNCRKFNKFLLFFMGRNEKNKAQKKSLCALFSMLRYFERKSKMNQKVHQAKQIKRGWLAIGSILHRKRAEYSFGMFFGKADKYDYFRKKVACKISISYRQKEKKYSLLKHSLFFD